MRFPKWMQRTASPSAGQSSVSNIDDEHLISILANSSRHAAQVYDWLREEYLKEDPHGRSLRKRQLTVYLRQTATLRDSLDQVARLVAGEELPEAEDREIAPDVFVQQQGAPLEVISSVVEGSKTQTDEEAFPVEEQHQVTAHVAPLRDVSDELALDPYSPPLKSVVEIEREYRLREAHLYGLIKKIKQGIGADDTRGMANLCQEALDYIKEQ